MRLKDIKIGFCFTGSFCTLLNVLPQVQKLIDEGAEVFPIFSFNVASLDTRFTSASAYRMRVESITGKKVIDTIVDAEPIGPQNFIDIIIIAPCTGNTLSKLVNGITDTPVLMAAKAQLRNQKPVVLAIATNDGMGNNGKNIGTLLNAKNIYIVPFFQDDPITKTNSVTADISKIVETVYLAMNKKQIQPIILEKK